MASGRKRKRKRRKTTGATPSSSAPAGRQELSRALHVFGRSFDVATLAGGYGAYQGSHFEALFELQYKEAVGEVVLGYYCVVLSGVEVIHLEKGKGNLVPTLEGVFGKAPQLKKGLAVRRHYTVSGVLSTSQRELRAAAVTRAAISRRSSSSSTKRPLVRSFWAATAAGWMVWALFIRW
jgi:hypothetical protein